MKNRLYILPTIIDITLAVGIVLGRQLVNFYIPKSPPPLPFLISDIDTVLENPYRVELGRLTDYIEEDYMDNVSVDSIVDLTINSISRKSDPHSTCISKTDIQGVVETMSDKFVRVGISSYMYRDTIAVIRPIEGSDTMKKGIHFGGRILMANKDALLKKWLSTDKIKNILKGKMDSKVDLTIYRRSKDSIFRTPIERKFIPIKSIDCFYKVNDTLRYIRMNRFAETTYNEFSTALKVLEREEVNSLILDLRNNSGGFLNVGIQIADEFLPKNKMIVFTKNNRKEIEETFSTEGGLLEDKPMFILTNENAASASEVVAGALQDNDRGAIVDRRTFGRGLVQSEMLLPDGPAVRLITARYYTSTGRSIQEPYGLGHQRRSFQIDNATVPDSLKFIIPKGKVVCGGGGIYPDVYVPIDMKLESYLVNEVLRSGLTSFFLFEYLDSHPSLNSKPHKAYFITDCKVPKEILMAFAKFLRNRRINLDFGKNSNEITRHPKASLAKIWFSNNVTGLIRNQHDSYIGECLHYYHHKSTSTTKKVAKRQATKTNKKSTK